MRDQPSGWDGKWANGLDEAIDRLNQQHFEVKPTERNHMDSRDRSAFKYICEQARAFQLLKRLPELLIDPKFAGVSLTVIERGPFGFKWLAEGYDMEGDQWPPLTKEQDTPEEALKSALEKNKDVK